MRAVWGVVTIRFNFKRNRTYSLRHERKIRIGKPVTHSMEGKLCAGENFQLPQPQKSMCDDKKEAELLVNKLYIYIRFGGLAAWPYGCMVVDAPLYSNYYHKDMWRATHRKIIYL